MAQAGDCKCDGCVFDTHSKEWINLLIFWFLRSVNKARAPLNSATLYAMPLEFGGKWGTELLTLGSLCLPGKQREANKS